MSKVSIRFYNDREVRAIWDEDRSNWWFSVLDIVGVLNGQDNYTKNRNYWKYLKTKLKKENNQLVSDTNQLKLIAPDGKSKSKAYALFESNLINKLKQWYESFIQRELRSILIILVSSMSMMKNSPTVSSQGRKDKHLYTIIYYDTDIS